MKKLFLLSLMALVFLSCQSQPAIQAGLGVGVGKKLPVVEYNIGLEQYRIICEFHVSCLISNRVDAQTGFAIKVGYVIPLSEYTNLYLAGGYVKSMRTTDYPELNKDTYIVSATCMGDLLCQEKSLDRGRTRQLISRYYFRVTYFDNTVIPSVGLLLHIKTIKDESLRGRH